MNPIAISYIWSALAFSVGGALVDYNNLIINLVGWALVVFAVLSARALNMATFHVSAVSVHLTALILLFASVVLVNKVFPDPPLSYAILGLSFPMLFVSGFRFFNSVRG